MTKRILVLSIAILVITALAAGSVALAWFTTSASYRDIIVTTGVIEAEADLYYYEDFDHDGVLDEVNGQEVLTPIVSPNIYDIKPGDIYYYRLDVLNAGSIDCDLSVYFDGIPLLARNVLTVESLVRDDSEQEIIGAGTSGQRQSLTVDLEFAAVNGLEGTKYDQNPPQKQCSIYFKIKFELLEDLKLLLPSVFGEAEDLNDYQNIDLSEMKIVVNLTQAAS